MMLVPLHHHCGGERALLYSLRVFVNPQGRLDHAAALAAQAGLQRRWGRKSRRDRDRERSHGAQRNKVSCAVPTHLAVRFQRALLHPPKELSCGEGALHPAPVVRVLPQRLKLLLRHRRCLRLRNDSLCVRRQLTPCELRELLARAHRPQTLRAAVRRAHLSLRRQQPTLEPRQQLGRSKGALLRAVVVHIHPLRRGVDAGSGRQGQG
mmetsp:Transcript_44698/g.111262  ORF Transcript_44698/g.111262 Transcript_44698/m.111262 type:complete len:208 (-) Transcript_44698:431-1054(-)